MLILGCGWLYITEGALGLQRRQRKLQGCWVLSHPYSCNAGQSGSRGGAWLTLPGGEREGGQGGGSCAWGRGLYLLGL